MPIRPEVTSAAGAIGVEPRVLAAVIAVESSGAGIVAGRPVIRLEAHLLWQFSTERRAVDARFRVGGPRPWQGHTFRRVPDGPWEAYHGHQDTEWTAFDIASAIDADAAIRATSWGLGQVLGENYHRCGFDNPDDFRTAQASEAGQIATMARFVAGDVRMLGSLRAQAWRTFALHYNGPGQPDWYAQRLLSAYQAIQP